MVAGYGENLIDSVWGFEFSIFSKKWAFGIHITANVCFFFTYT
jgi:hypothetical protein